MSAATAARPGASGRSGERPLTVFLIAGEESGDRIGAPLIRALREQHRGRLTVVGVGGDGMIAEGLAPLFPMDDIIVMGMDESLRRLPTLIARLRQAAAAAVAARPDVLVLIDAPDFNLRVARRVRRRAPDIPIVDYVSPTVWAWRPGRARVMARYVDRLLAILPFEPEVHARLGGPPTVYVGHPLITSTGRRTGADATGHMPGGTSVPVPEAAGETPSAAAPGSRQDDDRPILLILPGSRAVELDRLLAIFGEALVLIDRRHPGGVRALLPAVGSLAERIAESVAGWPVRPEIVVGAEAKAAAFGAARAAIAASGTVTLELALAGVPMVVAYRLDRFYRQVVKRLNRVVRIVTAPSMVLANIIIGRNAIPELLDEEVTAEALAGHALELLADGAPRERQLAALAEVADKMAVSGSSPSARAAAEILDLLATRDASGAAAR